MEAIVLNTELEAVGIIDSYKSFIWTDRYNERGEFEICLLGEMGIPKFIQKEYYLITPDSDRTMIIEAIQINTDVDEGPTFLIRGRSLESILERRIVWTKTSFEATYTTNKTTGEITVTKPNLQNGIKRLLDEAIINPAISSRKIDNFVFEESTDEKVTELTFEGQYLGEDLYTIIKKLCQENNIGFKIILNEDYQFVFSLYAGVDRSYDQETNPYVIFSPRFDNVLNTNYLDSVESFKNVTLVGGESEKDENGEEISRDTYVVELAGYQTGMTRREVFTDANGVNRNVGNEDELTEEQYQAHLRQAGIDTLIDNTTITAFEAEIDPSMMYVYGEDYFIGDVVQIENEYGHEGTAYIAEYIMSCDEGGISAYPTFITIQKGVYDTE